MEQPNIVIINVSGTRFEVEEDVLSRIPTLKGKPRHNNQIWVPRSPANFQHILALAIDDRHHFPHNLAYELEWYGIDRRTHPEWMVPAMAGGAVAAIFSARGASKDDKNKLLVKLMTTSGYTEEEANKFLGTGEDDGDEKEKDILSTP